jgi:hypothetical protein
MSGGASCAAEHGKSKNFERTSVEPVRESDKQQETHHENTMKKIDTTTKTSQRKNARTVTLAELSAIVGGYLSGAEGGDPVPFIYQPLPPPR